MKNETSDQSFTRLGKGCMNGAKVFELPLSIYTPLQNPSMFVQIESGLLFVAVAVV